MKSIVRTGHVRHGMVVAMSGEHTTTTGCIITAVLIVRDRADEVNTCDQLLMRAVNRVNRITDLKLK